MHHAKKICPAAAVDPPRTDDDRTRVYTGRGNLAFILCPGVDAARIRLVILRIKSGVRTIENIIGRDRHKSRIALGGRFGKISNTERIRPGRGLGFGLGTVYIGVSSAVQDRVRAMLVDRREHRVAVADIEPLPRECDNFIADLSAMRRRRLCDHPVCSRDKDLHCKCELRTGNCELETGFINQRAAHSSNPYIDL
jgi:hypothetical protein